MTHWKRIAHGEEAIIESSGLIVTHPGDVVDDLEFLVRQSFPINGVPAAVVTMLESAREKAKDSAFSNRLVCEAVIRSYKVDGKTASGEPLQDCIHKICSWDGIQPCKQCADCGAEVELLESEELSRRSRHRPESS